MKTVHDKYPVFEANQVLSNLHLNQLFDYLSEQERLTRANLIGTGIACGLGIRLDGTTVHLEAGCGITTEGYLVVEADGAALTSYRDYNLPLDVDYPLLRPYPLWELFPAGEPETTALSTPATFLDNKAVLLFVELKKEGLRNCSPNDCNDRGSQLTVTVRRLLIGVSDLAKVIAAAADLSGGMTTADLEAALLARLNLPDLRLPRYDVPNTYPSNSEHVLAAFQAVFGKSQLAKKTGEALSAAYQAFKPLLEENYPSNPFGGYNAKYGFLDTGYGDSAKALFLQYYYDLFDDVLRAYDEMRWKGVELICACVPSELLFPRHLMLGIPRPVGVANPQLYRIGFTPACAGEALRDEFVMLFGRLAGMLGSFTHQPALPAPTQTYIDTQIRITPSVLGTDPLGDKALPYYYHLDGTPPLYEAWSPLRSRRRRANQNLGYRSAQFLPAAPAFVLEPLNYDLEPRNFLRIEGHLGKQYQSVLQTLLTLRRDHRLPIEVVALRTGAFDEKAPLPATDKARFPDLETLYDVLREEVLSGLTEGIRYLYDVPADTKLEGGTPKHPLLKLRAPQFKVDADTVGAWYEKYLAGFLARPYIDVDQDKIDGNQVLMVYCQLFMGTVGLQSEFWPHVVSIFYMTKLSQALPASLDALAYSDFENKCEDLLGLTHHFRDLESSQIASELKQFMPKEELIDHFDQILYGANLEAMKALHEEYIKRLRDLKQQQMLSYFLQKHPGIQHKAGVPLGGTFLLVYHEEFQQAPGQLPPVLKSAVDSLAAGVVIADFYLPYRVGGEGPGIQYVLPLPPLGLTIKLGCTDVAGSAAATLTPEGGMAPIVYQLDGQPFKALTPTVMLSAGDHTLMIRDSAGAESALQAVTVPGNLRMTQEAYLDDAPALSWQVTFIIAGGVMPYKAENGSIEVNRYTSKPVPSGEAIKVEILDSAGCSTSKEFKHEVKPPCDLPCDGMALRCGHRFWLPDADTVRPFETFGIEVPAFNFEFKDGKTVDLQADIEAMLSSGGAEGLNASYDKTVRAWVKKINEMIAQAIGSADWLILEYDTKSAAMPILWIEHFECLNFDIQIWSFFNRAGINYHLDVRYTPQGTGVMVKEQVIQIPPFNCSRIAKCDPQRPVTVFCKPLDMTLKVSKSIAAGALALDVEVSGSDEPLLFIWEVQECDPLLVATRKASFGFLNRNPPLKAIRLSAFTEAGCMVVVNDQIDLRG